MCVSGLMQQFGENLCEAGLVDGSAACLRLWSGLNQHSQQEQLVRAVLIAGLYPHLIQVRAAPFCSTCVAVIYEL